MIERRYTNYNRVMMLSLCPVHRVHCSSLCRPADHIKDSRHACDAVTGMKNGATQREGRAIQHGEQSYSIWRNRTDQHREYIYSPWGTGLINIGTGLLNMGSRAVQHGEQDYSLVSSPCIVNHALRTEGESRYSSMLI